MSGTDEENNLESNVKSALDNIQEDDDLFDPNFDPETQSGMYREPERKKSRRQAQRADRAARVKKEKETRANEKKEQKKEMKSTVKPAPKVSILQSLTSAPANTSQLSGGMQGIAFEPSAIEDLDQRIHTLLHSDNTLFDDNESDEEPDLNAILFGTGIQKDQPRDNLRKETDEEIKTTITESAKHVAHDMPQDLSPTGQFRNDNTKEVLQCSSPPAGPSRFTAARKIVPDVSQAASTSATHEVKMEFLSSSHISTPMKSEIKVEPGPVLPSGESLEMYWIDARELPRSKDVYFFGKMCRGNTEWKSCSLRVRNPEHVLFILPRITLEDGTENSFELVVQELTELCQKVGIRRRYFKKVERWYAFGKPNVPTEKTTWVKMRYSAMDPSLPLENRKHKTFTEVFGQHRSCLENLLLKRRIMGPCWLQIDNPISVLPGRRVTYCSEEFEIEGMKQIHTLSSDVHRPSPKLCLCSINLITELNAKRKTNEILGISVLTLRSMDTEQGSKLENTQKVFWTGLRKPEPDSLLPFGLEEPFLSRKLPSPEIMNNEKTLLENFLSYLLMEDPDIVVGHNFYSFHLDVLLHRLSALKVANWSRLGRLRLHEIPKLQAGVGGMAESSAAEREVLAGRLCCDTYLIAKEYVKATSYNLGDLAAQLNLSGTGISNLAGDEENARSEEEQPPSRQMSTKDGVFGVVSNCMQKAFYATGLALFLDIIPLTKRMTTLAGNVWSRTMNGARAERIEFLLLHKFYANKFVLPDKPSFRLLQNDAKDNEEDTEAREIGGKRKAKYMGGMVLEPRRGLYTDYVLLLDFNSLYPSIIQEFNICFTTVRHTLSSADSETAIASLPTPDQLICEDCARKSLQGPCKHRNILPKVLKELVDSRREVKKLIHSVKQEDKRRQLEIRQKALKLTANSMYGCLGFCYSRFYAQFLAELITQQGRDALTQAVELVPRINPNLQVIYGDTDSVMISTGITQDLAAVRAVAQQIKDAVNKSYKTLEIDIDGIFRTMLLVRKKKYAALQVVDFMEKGIKMRREIKGLDVVRREWCALSKNACNFILEAILTENPQEKETSEMITDYLLKLAERIKNHEISLDDLVVYKSLAKEPKEYQNVADHPHVCVALRMKERNESVQVGDLIPYIVCEAETTDSVPSNGTKLSQRCFHPFEMKENSSIGPDILWYVNTQLFPPVTRLLEHIDGCNLEMVAEAMGLDPKKVVHTSSTSAIHIDQEKEKFVQAQRYANPEEVFVKASHLSVQCPRIKCRSTITIQPHKYFLEKAFALVERLLDPKSDLTNMKSLIQPHPWYSCPGCSFEIPFKYVMNCVTLSARKAQGNYYTKHVNFSLHLTQDEMLEDEQSERITEDVLRQQFDYFEALFSTRHILSYVEGRIQDKIIENQGVWGTLYTVLERLHPPSISHDATGLAKALVWVVHQHTICREFVEGDLVGQPLSVAQFDAAVRRSASDTLPPQGYDYYFDLHHLAQRYQHSAVGQYIPLSDLFGEMGLAR